MRDIIDDYLKKYDKKEIRAKQLYEIYCLIEQSEGRTPIARFSWDIAIDSYFHQLWKFIIRLGYIFTFRYNIGSYCVKTVNEFRFKYRFYWRQKTMKVTKRWGGLYSFKPINGNTNYGKTALQAWASEIKKGQNIRGSHIFY